MRTRSKLALGLVAAILPGYALARDLPRKFVGNSGAFNLAGRPVGGSKAASPTAAHLTGSRIMAAGDGALVIDADSGALLKTDRTGAKIGEVAIARSAGLMTFDPATKLAYVADRMNDRIAVVKTDTMEVASSIRTPAEPYGIALTPDRKQLLVSTIADRTLVAYDVATGAEKWRTPLGSEPRGLAVSPDGTRAMVAYLTTGTTDQIDLIETRRAEHIALSSEATPRRCRRCGNDGDSFARGSFAVTFLGDHLAVVPFQREVPVQETEATERTGSYGGGSASPLTQELAFFGFGNGLTEQTTATIALHQPRAMAWDQAHDALYVVGLGTDEVVQIRNASQVSIAAGLQVPLASSETHCGPDGIAVGATGKLMVWCSFSRTIKQIDVGANDEKTWDAGFSQVTDGPELVASSMTAKQHQGLELFHVASEQISESGRLACASCHPDNRADGLSWRIDKRELQTPLLSGRLVGTHPFKWDGTDPTLRSSLRSTMKRLGGSGLDRTQTDALAAYLEALPAVRTPTREATQVVRGKALFESEGCRSCHDGPAYTDRERHKLAGTLKESDTPSLIGVSASAPYFHDGSAATLEALLRDRGAVHGMADTARLTDSQVADLSAFLDTL
ncbi:MAG TPA: c-type cytochrome [Kofleriaceae bacterium]|nr:c-type cytochrome [Kofleriaceae bacterium]